MSLSQQRLTRTAFALALACGLGSIGAAQDAPADEIAQGTTPKAPEGKDAKEKDKKEKGKKADPAAPESWHRDGLALKKDKNRIELAGYVQEDFRHYDWTVKGDETGERQAPTHELRRLRIGAKAKFGDLSLDFGIDPRESESPGRLKDASAAYEFSKKFSLIGGHFKPSVSQEFLTSAGKTDFVDRSMVASRLAPDREWGGAAYGELGRVEYTVGVFAGDGDANHQSAETSLAARLTVGLLKGLHVSGSFMEGKVTADPREGSNEPAPKGASGQTATGFTFFDRPHVDGTRQRLGGDVNYLKGAFHVQAEYLQMTEQRHGQGSTGQDIPDVRGRGWNVQAAYVFGGIRKSSTFAPARSVLHGGWGALELAVRAESLKFDDTGDPSGFAGYGNRARNIAPSSADAIQAGLNYMPTTFMKLQGSALWESYNDPLITPVPGNTGKYFSLLARIMFVIP